MSDNVKSFYGDFVPSCLCGENAKIVKLEVNKFECQDCGVIHYVGARPEPTIKVSELREWCKQQRDWSLKCPKDFRKGYDFAHFDILKKFCGGVEGKQEK